MFFKSESFHLFICFKMRVSLSYAHASRRAGVKNCEIVAYLTLLPLIVAAQETCYWPNGVLANTPAYYPCHEGNSTCCLLNEACILNGLCYGSLIDRVKTIHFYLAPISV